MFNLADDPAEQVDLREAEPEQFAHLVALWDEYEREQGVIVVSGLNSEAEGEAQ
jgi:hypothetical protein